MTLVDCNAAIPQLPNSHRLPFHQTIEIEESIELDDVYRDYCAQKMREHIEKNKLDTSTKVHLTTKRGKDGTTTLGEYLKRFESVRAFALLIGDWRTAVLMDRDICPSNPHPASPRTIQLYMRYMSGKAGTWLTEPGNSQTNVYGFQADASGKIVKDLKIPCVGAWHSPGCLEKFKTAITTLHEAYPMLKGAYFERCRDCDRLNKEAEKKKTKETKNNSVQHDDDDGKWLSCRQHANNPLLEPRGNVFDNEKVKRTYNKCHAVLIATHKRKGNTQLTPAQVRRIRSYLLGHTMTAKKLQMYVMILTGIRLFLRADELIGLKVEQLDKKLTIVDAETIKQIVFVIKGKSDRFAVRLKVYRDDRHPEFCLIRHLFAYVRMVRIGYHHCGDINDVLNNDEEHKCYLFPGPNELKEALSKCDDPNGPQNIFSKHIEYSTFLNALKGVVLSSCGDDFNGFDPQFGTHTLRKTAYLFAIWGILTTLSVIGTKIPDTVWGAVQKSARHQTICHSATYSMDSASTFASVSRERHAHRQAVSPWEDIHVENGNEHLHYQITVPSRRYQGDLVELSWHFIDNELKVKKQFLEGHVNVHNLLTISTDKNKEQEDEELLLAHFHTAELPPVKKEALIQAFQRVKNRADAQHVEEAVRASMEAAEAEQDNEPVKKKAKRANNNNNMKEDRDVIDRVKKDKKAREFWLYLNKIKRQKALTQAAANARSRLLKALPSVEKCLAECCGGDEYNFDDLTILKITNEGIFHVGCKHRK